MRAEFCLAIISGTCWSARRERRRSANLAWRRLKSALAGVSLLSAATIPSGVNLKAPSLVRPMWLMAAWYLPSTPFFPSQVSSNA